MKIMISYPPLENEKGCPTIGQNRQFQYFKEPTYIYPVVPAVAATLLKNAGHQVIWNDCVSKGWRYKEFINYVKEERPDLIAFETKTPVIKQIWKVAADLKSLSPDEYDPLIVLFGDHVSALPEESFLNSKADFILTGGDYDFLLLNLVRSFREKKIKPELLEPGIYYRDNQEIRNTGKFLLNHDLNSLPFIDRELTQWQLYAVKNGNYKVTPGTYIMSGRDCWWGKCTFCSWTSIYPEFRARKTGNVLDEIGTLIEKYRVKEIMDDTGCFPAGGWLKEFSKEAIRRGYHKKIYLDCNMRFGALSEEDFRLMKKANFRLLLFGLESANQETSEKINKNLKVERIIQDCKLATKSGLFPHITIMFGYPWENYADAEKTFKLGQWLLKKGYAYTMQATVVIPYPGTPLFEECRQKNLLKSLDWNNYDMKQPIMQTGIEDERIMGFVQSMYKISFHPEFIARKLFSIRDIHDLYYYLRAAKKVFGHILDFKKRECAHN